MKGIRLASIVVAVVAVAALAWALQMREPIGVDTQPAAVTIAVEERGTVHFLGNVTAATALDALLAAAEAGNFTVQVTGRAASGPPSCIAYVTAIAGTTADGPTGWVYRVERGGASDYPRSAPDCFALEKGDRVVWHWTDGSEG